ncbi:MAG TPA: 4'-phosphopantetheinyl transferase superfamily protein [Blastocatellia bacterium]|nr:4'-phosphopantetheinyl transferase superfamily protein [Blastocatellia bacterium]
MAVDIEWRAEPEPSSLSKGDVDIWFVFLGMPVTGSPERLLADDERKRAARFHLQRDRRWYIAAHASLRRILGRYLDKDPSRIQFDYGKNGKPHLSCENDTDGLCFNLSCSHGIALIAVTRGLEVGVDVERIEADVDIERMAERFFSAREREAVTSLPEARRREAFFACWTLKEAYVKAIGAGLSVAPESFDVSAGLTGTPARLTCESEALSQTQWVIQRIASPAGYQSALALNDYPYRVRYGQWRDG